MLKYSLLLMIAAVSFFSCKKKKNKDPDKQFISALSLIQAQVAHVDTSMYPILRIDIKDSVHHDTVYIKREEFREAAKAFLDIPDLFDKKTASRFKEETLYDGTLNSVMISYTPLDPASEQVQKIQLLVTPNTEKDKVNTIIINKTINTRDSAVQQNMLWKMDEYFQVTTIRLLPGKPEVTTTTRVTWNEDPYQ